jgi:Protein of unknown function (DUF1592)/Protein of unknown function (DUF1588)/Protein of unknown function (DUF1587)/Protein of unknown function (DUF1595)/Protein of unknown function (DUF1585)/Planctomycete cytochrome C
MMKDGIALRRLSMTCGVAIFAATFASAQTPKAAPRALLNQYCLTCHNEKLKTGNLALEKMDVDHVAANAETWEKVVRKLRAGMMPPAGMPRPAKPVMNSFLSGLEASLDRAAAAKPNPGAPALHRMNRGEYANSIRDLIAVDIDAANLLPADDSSEGFDNIADVLGVSPALLDRYIAAAAKISRLAIGDPDTSPTAATYKARGDLSQNDQIEGLPAGTRGGMLIHHTFPLDGEYNFRVSLLKGNYGWWGEAAKGQQIEVTVNGERVSLVDLPSHVYYYMRPTGPAANGRGGAGTPSVQFKLSMKAGPQAIGVAFIKQDSAAVDDIFQRFDAAGTNDLNLGYQHGFTTVPHVASLDITGPYNATGPGDTPSRRRIFVCHPTSETDEIPCATKIISTLARRAYRRPVTDTDTEDLLSFYQAARNKGAFDTGIEMVLRRMLADPEFVFRYERDPANLSPGAAHRVSDLELASRLSFFLWSSIPDDELLDLAVQGKLKDPAVLQRQVRRMLADSRSQSLVTNFAGQWLYLRELKNSSPDSLTFPDFDDNLRQAFRRETELFFQSILHEDRSVLDLLNANYTFVNERLAKHYEIPNVYGNEFRRVTLENDARRGLLGQGSILLVTSVANRTSPVARGKWILENILGTPPPLPPPNVPPLKESAIGTAAASVRERMEEHRSNPVCASCHKLMDPIGFSLENFDAVGHWRDIDSGFKIDATGQLVDGSKLNGPASLRNALLTYPDAFTGTMTEKLLMYAVGRELHYYDMPVVRGIMAGASHDNLRFSSIVLGIVKSALFRETPVSGKGDWNNDVHY